MVDQVSPALIMVDIMLPGIDGLALCRVLKSSVMTRGVPIIMVSAKGEEADIVAGPCCAAMASRCMTSRPRLPSAS